MDVVSDILGQGVMITGFVLIMMLVIEYLNVLTGGNWDRVIARWTWGQSALASLLGVSPGCLGAYAVASLYMHRVLTGGALVAAMIATCGDEAFVMLALFPRQALAIFAVLFLTGMIAGVATDLLTRSRRTRETAHHAGYRAAHVEHPQCVPFSSRELVRQWRNCTPHRGWLAFFLVLFLVGVLSGAIRHGHLDTDTHAAATYEHLQEHPHAADVTQHAEEEHDAGHWDWVRITLMALGLIALAIVASVPDHFLDEHLWHHLIRIHAWRIFLWTVGALVVTHIVTGSVDFYDAVQEHRLPVLLSACLIGLLPASGPHLVFVTLYADSTIPLSTLLANCIVQDGHGLIPVLSHSRRAFLILKGAKFVLGLAVGLLGYLLGW